MWWSISERSKGRIGVGHLSRLPGTAEFFSRAASWRVADVWNGSTLPQVGDSGCRFVLLAWGGERPGRGHCRWPGGQAAREYNWGDRAQIERARHARERS